MRPMKAKVEAYLNISAEWASKIDARADCVLLLDWLYVVDRPLNIASLEHFAFVPSRRTARRWADDLAKHGFVAITEAPGALRDTKVEITDTGRAHVESYITALVAALTD